MVDLLVQVDSNLRSRKTSRDEVCEGDWIEKEEDCGYIVGSDGSTGPLQCTTTYEWGIELNTIITMTGIFLRMMVDVPINYGL